MATIHDVARRAGVSVKTVSRVMNNYEHVSGKTRDKVRSAIDALNYSPSMIARQMRSGDNSSIGMLYGDPSSGYQAQLNHSMLRACADAQSYLAVELFDEKSQNWADQVERFLDRTGVSRMMLVPPMCDSAEIHHLLKDRGVKFVLLSPSQPVIGASAVAMDDRMAARQMTEHLIGLGHRRIGHIAGHEGHIATLLRRLGYEDAMMATGLGDGIEGLIANGRFRFRQAMECADALLSRPDRPTAIFAANDHMAIAVMMAAHRKGLSVPEDLSVAGVDDTYMGRSVWPPLTTIAQPFDLMAKTAVEILCDPAPAPAAASSTHILPHQLIIRESTSRCPMG